MMNKFSVRNISGLVLAGFILSACGGSDASEEEMIRISEKFKIKNSEKPALMACIDASDNSSPYVQLGTKTMLLEEIPLEVCGCQTKTIATAFNKDGLGGYSAFMKWAVKPGRKGGPRLKKTQFAKDEAAKLVTERLAKSLDGCTLQYVNANIEEGVKLLSPYIDEAKQKKDAEAKKKKEAAEAEKKKSAS